MDQSFDAYEYADCLRSRWRLIAAACAIALALAAILSLVIPNRYTATASILIDPPAGNDPRNSTAVSPIYLESLKTYEYLATSDHLFARALDHLHLRERYAATPIESVKRQVLKVSKLRDTKILQISVTLPDPKTAQALVEYLSQETVKLSQSLARNSEEELIRLAQQQADAARVELEESQKRWRELSAREPAESLDGEIEALTELKSRTRREWIEANAEGAGYPDRTSEFARQQINALRAKAGSLEKQSKELDRELEAKTKLLAQRRGRLSQLESQMDAATTAATAAAARLRDVRASAGTRGERLSIVDPGFIPQKPSFPNWPLNLAAALVLALVGSVLYLSVAFGAERRAARDLRTEAFSLDR